MEIGTSDRRRCIDIRNVASEIRYYSFSGNDYTSAFYETGKVKALIKAFN